MPDDHECEACGGVGRVSDPVPVETRRTHGRLERGWRKRWLMIELAKGELDVATLAHTLGAAPQSVWDFRKRHEAEIEAMVRDLEREFVALWVADKAHRLAEYQQDISDANEIIMDAMEPAAPRELDPLDPGAADEDGTPGSNQAPVWVRIKQNALRAVAEELGQIPNRVRMDLGGSVVTYRIEGEPGQPPVDLDQV
jgi:hypothetical protein